MHIFVFAIILSVSVLYAYVFSMPYDAKRAPKATPTNVDSGLEHIEYLKDFTKVLEKHRDKGYKESCGIGSKLLYNIVTFVKDMSTVDGDLSNESIRYLQKYESMIRKINMLYSDEIFISMKDHPEKWENPEERIAEIIHTVKMANDYIVKDIKKANKAKDLDINIAISSVKEQADSASSTLDTIFAKTDKYERGNK